MITLKIKILDNKLLGYVPDWKVSMSRFMTRELAAEIKKDQGDKPMYNAMVIFWK